MVKHFNDLSMDDKIMVMLEQVIDPELGIDLVNLGLIYDVSHEGDTAFVTMTFTTPECPLRDIIEAEIKRQITAIPEINHVDITVTFTPRWTMENLSRYARIALGL